jgi:lipopolysaccharide transport system ATP-binding protein
MKRIVVDNISKRYHIGRQRSDSLRDAVTGFFNGNNRAAAEDVIWALRDVSFSVSDGETLGIMGRNGAGKSTLLKVLSRITRPTSGSARIIGSVGSLLEVGTGFHLELSGRENIYLNGAILGLKHSDIEHKFDEIVAFSELEKFLDTPVKHYSSGMYMRLAFSVAAHLEPDVLIVDEVLAVGDTTFQQKCLGKMDEVGRSGRTVLFVSHNLGSLAQVCKNGLLLDQGKIEFAGTIDETIDRYLSRAAHEHQFKVSPDLSKRMQIVEAVVQNCRGEATTEIPHDQAFSIEFKALLDKPGRGTLFCVALLNKYKERVFTEHKALETFDADLSSSLKLRFEIPGHFIAPNRYSFLLQIFLPSGEVVDNLFDICAFSIIDTGSELADYRDYGFVQVRGQWHVDRS